MLLTSAGLTDPSIVTAFGSLLPRPFDGCKAAFVPTAAHMEEDDKSWLLEDMLGFQGCGFQQFDIVEFAALSGGDILQRCGQADVVIFGGGNPFFLMDIIEQKGIKNELVGLFKSRVYVGVSAGSQIAGPSPALASETTLYGDLGGGDDPWRPALGLANVYFRPHLESPDFPCATSELFKRLAPRLPGPAYALSDDNALQIIDGEARVLGPGKVLTANAD